MHVCSATARTNEASVTVGQVLGSGFTVQEQTIKEERRAHPTLTAGSSSASAHMTYPRR